MKEIISRLAFYRINYLFYMQRIKSNAINLDYLVDMITRQFFFLFFFFLSSGKLVGETVTAINVIDISLILCFLQLPSLDQIPIPSSDHDSSFFYFLLVLFLVITHHHLPILYLTAMVWSCSIHFVIVACSDIDKWLAFCYFKRPIWLLQITCLLSSLYFFLYFKNDGW